MVEVSRVYLIIPTPEELGVAFGGMRARVMRAAERGVKPEKFGDVGYERANMLLAAAPHLDAHLRALAKSMVEHGSKLTAEEIFLAGAKDMLEILANATTYSQMPDLGDVSE